MPKPLSSTVSTWSSAVIRQRTPTSGARFGEPYLMALDSRLYTTDRRYRTSFHGRVGVAESVAVIVLAEGHLVNHPRLDALK